METCPQCGSALETSLRIDLDDVVVENGVVVSFTLADSANDPSTGLVYEEARVTCVDHEHVIDAEIPPSIMDHWSYDCPPARVLCIRDPDRENSYVTEGDVEIIDVDMGRSFNGPKDFDPVENGEWAAGRLIDASELPPGPIRDTLTATVREMLGHDKAANAHVLASLLNDYGRAPSVGLELLAIDRQEVFSEDPGLGLDDFDNDMIDLGWQDDECVVLKRGGRRHAKTGWEVQTITRTTPTQPTGVDLK